MSRRHDRAREDRERPRTSSRSRDIDSRTRELHGRSRSSLASRTSSDYGHRSNSPRDTYPRDRRTGEVRRGGRWGYKRLEELLKKKPDEVLLIMNNASQGFPGLLEDDFTNKPDWMMLVLAAMTKGYQCDSLPEGVAYFLNSLTATRFINQSLPLYLSSMPLEGTPSRQRKFKQPLLDAANLLKLYLEKLPANASHVLASVATLQFVVNGMKDNPVVVDDAVQSVLAELVAIRDIVIEDSKRNIRRDKGDPEREDKRAPPDDFRRMTIIPQAGDVMRISRPFLRKNKVQGAYSNLDHYLDVQFRLLREDMVAPLRESVAEYLKEGNPDRGRQVKNMRLYYGVRLLHPVCGNESIVYRIQFDNSMMKRVVWEHSKRLVYGSLVCLSKDDFKTVEFAVVSNRDNERMYRGILDIQFCNENSTRWHERRGITYTMAETTSYFEAYRHVLKGLQEITAESLPFQSYIVQCLPSTSIPRYLQEAEQPVYDLGCVLEKKEDEKPVYDSDSDESMDLDQIEDEMEIDQTEPVNRNLYAILDESQWPSASDMGLDHSQHKALRTALTQEVALIQGPPGTGKTYLGLKIMEIVLANKKLWVDRNQLSEHQSPILVVCYTNHALDQFLEGVSEFENSRIVRVGGRSKSALLEKYNLRSWRQKFREKRLMGKEIHEARIDAARTVDCIQGTIERSLIEIELCEKGIVMPAALFHFMNEEHYSQLQEYCGQEEQFSLVEWLEFDKACLLSVEEEKIVSVKAADADIDVEDEVSAALEQRILDEDLIQYDSEAERRKRLSYKAVTAELDIVLDNTIPIEYLTKTQARLREANFEKLKKLNKVFNHISAMTSKDAIAVNDVRGLDTNSRWRLYKYWVLKLKDKLMTNIHDNELAYANACHRKLEVLLQEDLCVMRTANVVGMTTTGAAKYRQLLPQLHPRIIMIEEAAEVLEAHIITTLTPSCQHLIMIGDHLQLRPNPAVFELAESYKLKVSLFERMVLNGMTCVTLEVQHRMRPEIARLLRLIYPNLKDAEDVKHFENVSGIKDNIHFVDHSVEEDQCEDNQSKTNIHEARFMAKLCHYLLKQGYRPSQVTILTPYTGQILAIRQFMPKEIFEGVRVCAVDNYQGEENDFILLSLVRSNAEKKIGFLTESNRICVALSRAKKGMYVLGNLKTFAEKNRLWDKVVTIAQDSGNFSKALSLRCRNHPDMVISASNPSDFDKAPEGGCVKLCSSRLRCGHVCERVCHSYDINHVDYRCIKPCLQTLCERGHGCPKLCYEECGFCRVVTRISLRCGHTEVVPCHVESSQVVCKQACTHRLACRHMCQNQCGESHTIKCLKLVTKNLLCGHSIELKCFERAQANLCKKPCGFTLQCGHPCTGTCGSCRGGRIHQQCTAVCGRTLVCGHQCDAPCTKSCPPCSKPCENCCVHSKCMKVCGELCTPCMEPCLWRCQHQKCSRLCSEPCDRQPCSQPCDEVLHCGHACIGVCGEQCPTKCRECDKEEVEEVFFGDEDEPDARFVELVDCRHFIEVEGLDQWMKTTEMKDDGDQQIQLKACPKCKTPIRKNLRYGALINETLTTIERVKKIVQGDVAFLRTKANDQLTRLKRMTKDIFSDDDMDLLKPTVAETITKQFETLTLGPGTVNMLENVVQIIEQVLRLKKRFDDHLRKGSVMSATEKNNVKIFLKDLTHWCGEAHERLSEQEEADVLAELDRIRLLVDWHILKDNEVSKQFTPPERLNSLEEQCYGYLTQWKPFTIQFNKVVKKALMYWEKSCPLSGFGLSEQERVMVVSAIGLSAGHWFKCPKGHIYAIGECGGAMEISKCPECGSEIGGTQHRLLGNNALAGEMAGATSPAYPTY